MRGYATFILSLVLLFSLYEIENHMPNPNSEKMRMEIAYQTGKSVKSAIESMIRKDPELKKNAEEIYLESQKDKAAVAYIERETKIRSTIISRIEGIPKNANGMNIKVLCGDITKKSLENIRKSGQCEGCEEIAKCIGRIRIWRTDRFEKVAIGKDLVGIIIIVESDDGKVRYVTRYPPNLWVEI